MKTVHALIGLPALVGCAVVALPVNNFPIESGNNDRSLEGITVKPNGNLGAPHGEGAGVLGELGHVLPTKRTLDWPSSYTGIVEGDEAGWPHGCTRPTDRPGSVAGGHGHYGGPGGLGATNPFTKRTPAFLGDGDINLNKPGCSINTNGGGIYGGGGAGGAAGHGPRVKRGDGGIIFSDGDGNSVNTNGRGINGGGDAAHTLLGNAQAGDGNSVNTNGGGDAAHLLGRLSPHSKATPSLIILVLLDILV